MAALWTLIYYTDMRNNPIDRLSDQVTTWVGSTASLLLHTLFFVCTFLLHWLFHFSFDSILLVLTTAVSLEAIYLAIFIQRAVNQQALRLDDVEESLDEVEDSIDEVEDALDDVEESISESDEPVEDLLREVKKLLKELKASQPKSKK